MKRLLCTTIAVWLGVCALLSHAETFSIAGDPYPPFGDPKDPRGGLAIELIREALKTQGHEVTMEFVPWARAEAGILNGSFDILPYTWRTEARIKVMAFSTPYAKGQVRFIKRKGDPFEYTDLDSLAGKTVGIVRGYGYGDAFNNATRVTREPANDLLINVRKLVRNRIDLTLEDDIVAHAHLQADEPTLLNQIEFVRNPLSVNPLYVTVGLQNPRAQTIINAFNNGLDTIKTNGTFERIVKRYGLDKSQF